MYGRLPYGNWAYDGFVAKSAGGGGFTPLFRKTLSIFGSAIGKRQMQLSSIILAVLIWPF